MATEKIANYTDEQTLELKAAYEAVIEDEKARNDVVTAFAEKFGKTKRSIVAKLVREKLYISKAVAGGKRDMLKSEMISEIAKLVGKEEEAMESLEKATGTALRAILVALRKEVDE